MFPPTDWKLIFIATLTGDPAGRKALNTLFTNYRPPVISFLRSKGWSAFECEDLAQQLFERLCETRAWKKADRAKGTFRTFLLTILQRIVSNNVTRGNTLKRGGGLVENSLQQLLDDSGWEPATEPEPCPTFDREWALNALGAAWNSVEARWVRLGKKREFLLYRQFLPGSHKIPEYSAVAKQLKIAEAAARKAVQRLRTELQRALWREVSATAEEKDVEGEMQYLGEVLANPGMSHYFEDGLCASNRP
ncbi:MAG TPA: sigma factor [Verrucomicrobiales bacterium]|jgi:RNA polymerase sigma-70 factor (ECF subfamily)|nr:sigma factor [Verrucomicrobiales bacterium]